MSVYVSVAGGIRMKMNIGLPDLVVQIQSFVFRSDPEASCSIFPDLYDIIATDPITLSRFTHAGKAAGC